MNTPGVRVPDAETHKLVDRIAESKSASDWRETEMGELIELFDRKRVPLSSRERRMRQGPFPYYGASGIIDHIDDYIFDGEYLLVAEDGENLNSRKTPIAFFAAGKFWVNNHAHVLRAIKGRAHDYFIKAWFDQADISGYITGAAQPKLSQANLKRMKLRVPPLPTQRRIAAILSAYDDLIENNTKRIAILEAMAQAIYREWFVHFRFPGHEQVTMVDSELGPIPEGWEVRQLGDVIELAYGKGLRKSDRAPGPYPVYGSSGVIDSHAESLVEGPGIVVGRKGNVGSVFWSDDDFYPIDTVFYVRTNACLHYVYYNLQYQNFISTDTAVPGLSRNQAYLLPILLPDTNLTWRFQNVVKPVFKQVRTLRSRNANLRRTRDLLLPRLISGEVDVSDLPIDTGGLTDD